MRRYAKSYQQIKVAKANHKETLKNPAKYIEKRNKMLSALLSHRTPRWGSIIAEVVPIYKLQLQAGIR